MDSCQFFSVSSLADCFIAASNPLVTTEAQGAMMQQKGTKKIKPKIKLIPPSASLLEYRLVTSVLLQPFPPATFLRCSEYRAIVITPI
jgi:hypothetical protein